MAIDNIRILIRKENSERDDGTEHGPTSRFLCWPQRRQSLSLGRHSHWPPRFNHNSPFLIHSFYKLFVIQFYEVRLVIY